MEPRGLKLNHPQILVQHRGRLGNRMFQAMVAMELQARVPNAQISGLLLPEWNLASPPVKLAPPTVVYTGHRFNLEEAAWLLRTGAVNSITLAVWGQRLCYFGQPGRYRSFFKPSVQGGSIPEDHILINVRAGDITSGWHSEYYPMPYAYYEHLIESTGLKPVFMGQLDDSDYIAGLKRKFSSATFLPPGSPLEDFETIRNAKNIVLSISTFSWLAAWLSEKAETIHIPIAGLFDPLKTSTLLLPIDDPRYRFYHVDFPDKADRNSTTAAQWATRPHQARELSIEDVRKRVSIAIADQFEPARRPVTSDAGT